ncbi:endonuclease III [bacterium]|nr:endonuclease III [bacterium]
MLDLAARKKRARDVIRILRRAFPDARCSLDHADAFQLLIATMLSAQCTDARVNLVTPDLFAAYPTPADFAAATQEEIEEAIRSTGFFRQKARSIRGACTDIVETHGGELPRTMPELVKLAGVGRKTANCVLGVAFDDPDGVVVDTHVGRIAGKLGLTAHGPKEAVKIERDLNACVPRRDWVVFGHLLIEHGRRTCRARNPLCDECPLYRCCEVRA